MTEQICTNGHVMDNGKQNCQRCNAAAVAPVAAPVEAPVKKARKTPAKPKSKSEAKRIKIQKGK